MKKALLVVAVCFGAYQCCREWTLSSALSRYSARHQEGQPARRPSPAGFVDALLPDEVNPEVMTVFTPQFCLMAAGVRGRALVAKMKSADFPVETSSSAKIQIHASTEAEFEAKKRLLSKTAEVMNGETPIVFFKGRAKANPSFEDVQLEYRTDNQPGGWPPPGPTSCHGAGNR